MLPRQDVRNGHLVVRSEFMTLAETGAGQLRVLACNNAPCNRWQDRAASVRECKKLRIEAAVFVIVDG